MCMIMHVYIQYVYECRLHFVQYIRILEFIQCITQACVITQKRVELLHEIRTAKSDILCLYLSGIKRGTVPSVKRVHFQFFQFLDHISVIQYAVDKRNT